MTRVQKRLPPIIAQILACHRHNVRVEQPCVNQFADHIAHATCRMEMVHIARAVGINPCDERHMGRKLIDIRPIDLNASGTRNGGYMDGVIGGAAGREQADDRVHNRLFHQCTGPSGR